MLCKSKIIYFYKLWRLSILLHFHQWNIVFFHWITVISFRGCYFHSVKISKVLFSQCENDKLLWRHVKYCIHVLRFEKNMFKIQRKCNKQKIQWPFNSNNSLSTYWSQYNTWVTSTISGADNCNGFCFHMSTCCKIM